MSALSVDRTAIVTTILTMASRATLPIREASGDRRSGTAFWFDDPDGALPGDQAAPQYLVTADALTRCDLGELLLRPGLCDPPARTDVLLMPGFADLWHRFGTLGAAVMPTAGLHAHAQRKGWRWSIDGIGEELAAREADTAAIGGSPVPAFVLGHPVEGPDRDRPQTVLTGAVFRCNDGLVRWDRATPDGCAGAPVFVASPDHPNGTGLVCAGLLLPGTSGNTVATFDRIRRAVRDLPPAVPRRRRDRKP